MSLAVGIDLGTTNSVLSIWRRGALETIHVDGRDMMPSVVSIRPDKSILVGFSAKHMLLADPENTFGSTKRDIGKGVSYKTESGEITPEEVATLILRRLAEVAGKALGEKITEAVITVPAYFNEDQRKATMSAAEDAGLRVSRLLPEPTAAAVAYGLNKGKDQTIMVYDLGGGTFDVSILEIKNNEFTVKAVGGDTRLGGDDFDLAVVDWVCRNVKAKGGPDIAGDSSREGKAARQKLKEACEQAKIELASASTAEISLSDVLGYSIQEEITLAEYNSLIAPFLNKTVECLRSTLSDAGLTAADIGRVILVGGSTKNKAVEELITREIKPPFRAEKVDLAVSHGAAIVAAEAFLPVSDVTAHSLSVSMLDNDRRLIAHPVIKRQTQLPCRGAAVGFTQRPMQAIVQIDVCRGEGALFSENTALGDLEMQLAHPSKEQKPIACLFQLDINGLLHFTAVEFSDEATFRSAMSTDGTLNLSKLDEFIASGKVDTKSAHYRTQ